MSQQVRREIRLQLLRSSDNLIAAAREIEEAIAALDTGDEWGSAASSATVSIGVARDQVMTARAFGLISALSAGQQIR